MKKTWKTLKVIGFGVLVALNISLLIGALVSGQWLLCAFGVVMAGYEFVRWTDFYGPNFIAMSIRGKI